MPWPPVSTLRLVWWFNSDIFNYLTNKRITMKQFLLTLSVAVLGLGGLYAQGCPGSITTSGGTTGGKLKFDYGSEAAKLAAFGDFESVTLNGTFPGNGGTTFINQTLPASDFNAAGSNTFFRGINVVAAPGDSFDGTATINYTVAADVTCSFSAGLLPVHFAGFTGVATARGVQLDWTTGSELNNDFFAVERSADGRDYQTLGTVKGAGNSSDFVDYQFTDPTAPEGVSYYRLRQVDVDGTAVYSEVISVRTGERIDVLDIFPTVMQNGHDLSVDLTDTEGRVRVELYDPSGRRVHQQSLTAGSLVRLVLPNLQDGMYLVRVQGRQVARQAKLFVRR